MASRKPVENPFAVVNKINRSDQTATEVTTVRPSGKRSRAEDRRPSYRTVQIHRELAEQLDAVAANIRERLPEKLRSVLENHTLNELGIAYLLSDHYAQAEGESIVARLVRGWEKVVKVEQEK